MRLISSALAVGFVLVVAVHSRSAALGAEPAAAKPGHRVLIADYQTKRIGIIDAAGTLVWEQPIDNIHDAQMLDNGNVLFQKNMQHVVEMTPEGETVWQYRVPVYPKGSPDRVEIHSFQRLPNGNTLIAESGSARLIELGLDGQIEKQIPLAVDHPDPHRDTRLVRKTNAGTYLVAHEGDQAVREYDAAGNVVWEYPVGSRVYSAVRLENGNTLIGTGDGHRVIEVSPEKEIAWSVGEHDLEGVQLAWVCGVERLQNGNTWIVNCHAGPENPQLIEVSPEKEVVWSFTDFDRFGNASPVGLLLQPRED